MPCYQVNVFESKVNVKNIDLVKQTLDVVLGRANAYTYDKQASTITVLPRYGNTVLDLKKGQVTTTSGIDWVNNFKRTYAMNALELVAKRKRWVLASKGNLKLQLKRY